MAAKDLTESIIHDMWMDRRGTIPKAVIREVVLWQFKWLRTAFLEKKNVHINELGSFGVREKQLKFLEEMGETIKNKLNDNK